MLHVTVDRYETWRKTALELVRAGAVPSGVCWIDAPTTQPYFGLATADQRTSAQSEQAPPEPLWVDVQSVESATGLLLERIERAACHRDATRWDLFYRLLWRVKHGETNLLAQKADRDVRNLEKLDRAMTRDLTSLLRDMRMFSGLPGAGGVALAWQRTQHAVLPLAVPELVRRDPLGPWTAFTPQATAEWDGHMLQFGPGMPCIQPPRPDDLVTLWQTYLRQNPRPGRAAFAISPTNAPRQPASTPQFPRVGAPPPTSALPRTGGADLVFVIASGKETEDSATSSRLLANALAEVGIDVARMCLIDLAEFSEPEEPPRPSVKRPSRRARWRRRLTDELNRQQPRLLVVLGAVAAETLFGPHFGLSRRHGQVFASPWASWTLTTYHPAALEHVPDATVRARVREQFFYDLQRVAKALAAEPAGAADADCSAMTFD